MRSFNVWVEVEEVDGLGNTRGDHSPMLEGAAIYRSSSLTGALEFGNKAQRAAQTLPLLDRLVEQVAEYREWFEANTDAEGDPTGSLAGFDESRTDWWETLADSAEVIASTYTSIRGDR